MEKITMMRANDSPTVEQAYELFERKCKCKNLTEGAIKSYRQKLKIFFDYYGKDNLVKEITLETVDDYIMYLRENTRANDVTINSYLRSLRAYLYYNMECGLMDQFKIRMIKAQKRIKETYSPEELERLLKKPDTKKCSFCEFRTWVFINFLVGTGCRLQTALEVKKEDIDFDSGIITFRKVKNRKQMIIPLSHRLEEVLREYLQTRGGNEEDYVFCNNYGEHGESRAFQQAVRDYNIRHNVNKTSCHLFRHTFSKAWILNGGDLARLSKVLGHSSIQVTLEYLDCIIPQDLQMHYDDFCILDQLGKREQIHISRNRKKGERNR